MPYDLNQLSPEEVEQLRSYGTALLQMPNMTDVRHPLQAFAHMFRAHQGRSALDRANRFAFLQDASRGASRLPPVGGRVPDFLPSAVNREPQTAQPTTNVVPPVRAQLPSGRTVPRGRMAPSRSPLPGQLTSPTPGQLTAPTELNTGTLLPEDLGPTEALPSASAPSIQIIEPQSTDIPVRRPGDNSPEDLADRFNNILGRPPSRGETALMAAIPNNFALVHAIIQNPNRSLYDLVRPFFRSTDETVSFMQESLYGGQQISEILSGTNPLRGIDYLQMLESGQIIPRASTNLTPNAPLPPLEGPAPSSPITGTPYGRQGNAPADGRMNLGGPRAEETGSINDPNIVPTQAGGAPAGNTPPAGFPSSIPPDRGLEYDLGNFATLTPEERTKVLERAQPRAVKNQFGTAYYDPLNGRFLSFVPEKLDIPGTGAAPGYADPQGGITLPPINSQSGGGPVSSNPTTDPGPFPYGNPRGIRQFETQAQIGMAAGASQGRIINDAREAGPLAQSALSTLNNLLTNTDLSTGAFRGPGNEFVLAAKQILANFIPQSRIDAIGNVANQEAINKLVIELGSLATRQLSNRPSNFEFQSFLTAFPGLRTTQQGAVVIMDILRQIQRRNILLAEAADTIRPDQTHTWQRVIDNIYNQNPITVTVPPGQWLTDRGIQGPARFVSVPVAGPSGMTDQQVRQWANTLPPDTYFIRNGRIFRSPGGNQPRQ